MIPRPLFMAQSRKWAYARIDLILFLLSLFQEIPAQVEVRLGRRELCRREQGQGQEPGARHRRDQGAQDPHRRRRHRLIGRFERGERQQRGGEVLTGGGTVVRGSPATWNGHSGPGYCCDVGEMHSGLDSCCGLEEAQWFGTCIVAQKEAWTAVTAQWFKCANRRGTNDKDTSCLEVCASM